MMTIRINGNERQLPEGMTIAQLMELYQLKPEAVVFELNRNIMSRTSYSATQLKEDDLVEIVHFVGGG